MKRAVFIAVAVTVCVVGITWASIPSASYSLNFHFIPPLVSAPCTFASVWNPSNMTCAMCFCLNGRISRCVPQPGCNPFPNATTTTPAPAPPNVVAGPDAPVLAPGGNASMPVMGNDMLAQAQAPSNATASPGQAVAGGQGPAASTPAPANNPVAPGRFRHAKFGKPL